MTTIKREPDCHHWQREVNGFIYIQIMKPNKHLGLLKTIFFIPLLINSWIIAFAFDAGGHSIIGNRFYCSHTANLDFQQADTVVPVKIQLEKTRFNDMVILFISDTAKQTQDIGSIFSNDYRELMKAAKEDQLKAKKFLAWYHSVQSPWIMDIAVETDKLPSALKGRIKSRIEKGGEVLIAHMWGPYSELSQAYTQIENWLKENNRIARNIPFEVYLNDPSNVKDPSEIQTDIYQPLQ